MVSLAYPIDTLDWSLFSVVILFHHWFPHLKTFENQSFILPHNFPAVLIIFAGQGTPPSPQCGVGRASIPALHSFFYATLCVSLSLLS